MRRFKNEVYQSTLYDAAYYKFNMNTFSDKNFENLKLWLDYHEFTDVDLQDTNLLEKIKTSLEAEVLVSNGECIEDVFIQVVNEVLHPDHQSSESAFA